MHILEKFEPVLSKAREGLFAQEIDKIISEYYQNPPPDSLEPKTIWHEKLRKELMEEFCLGEPTARVTRGFEAIVEDLKEHASAKEREKIAQEWADGVEKWGKENNRFEVKDDLVPKDTLSEILGFSEEMLALFYQAGARYFESKEFEKASDVFYSIMSLDPRLFNVWIALGLSFARCQNWGQALIAFSFASIIDLKAPLPYLYSADCCLKADHKEQAEIYLKLADEAIQNCEGEKGPFQELYKKLMEVL